ncbi:hypothetical protein FALBO_17154 [Fusarium albosuccineum]|uniref:Zn(2)-C6 fungal-type domain-containing protein n=1 Tax=Fusarium albosuccineum TaxID=1237068 RepID=A0A8H4K9B3_9HYPO|nr:hypothetical protein FALBO_17154 [Fusarium albosuccineum]
MASKVWTRQAPAGAALDKVQEAIRNRGPPVPIPTPSSDIEALKADGDSFTLASFTTEDAFELGNLLYARLYPFALEGKPTLISISLVNSSQVLYQTVTGPGVMPDNESWVQRKRNTVLRFGNSTWFMHNKFKGDEEAFAAKFAIGDSQKGNYAIHGGGIPIRVQGVEGIVAIVVVSGLKQDQDHGVIVDVIKENWNMSMNATKWRISKACQECRVKKIKCNGETPCQNCSLRSLGCVYREKARNRTRKVKPRTAAYETIMSHEAAVETPSLEPSDEGTNVPPTPTNPEDAASVAPVASAFGSERSINNNSVAATHRASPSCYLQLYYGPSSNFALLNSIYHQIAGTDLNAPREGVEEVGPGLDLFSHRRLFFGDLADNQRSTSVAEDYSAMLIDPETARRLLDRYLLTYWHGLPVMSKESYRRRLDALFKPPGIFDFDAPETIIIMLAMGLGASMTGEEAIAEFLFQKSKQGATKLDEVVNFQVVQIHLMMIMRKAIAAGLHKDACMCPSRQTEDEVHQRRIMFWSLFFWETWQCFVVGRPSSIPDPGTAIPVPKEQKLLISLVTLSRIMDKCVKRIYSPRHDSLLPVWNAAIEIRRELHQFAEQQLKDMKFGLVGDPSTGELGVCQAMVSTMYHHTLLLTFRPFLILRAKLKQERSSPNTMSAESLHTPPLWLDTACEYCLEAARNSIGFLTGSCATNILCHDIKYHGFFIEGACYALAFDMLQEKKTAHRNLPWIHSGLRCLRSMIHKAGANAGQLPTTIASIQQMVRSAGFELKDQVDPDMRQSQSQQTLHANLPGSPAMAPATGIREEPAFTFPSMPFGFDVTGQVNGASPESKGSAQDDFTAADMGWDIDFGTMNMEAFLSLDPTETFNFAL